MQRIFKLWWLFALMGILVVKLNPYADFLAGINAAELFVLALMEVANFALKQKESQYREAVRLITAIEYGTACVFFILKVITGILGVTLIKEAYTLKPDSIFGNPDKASLVLFVISMICNVVVLLTFIYKKRESKKSSSSRVHVNREKYKKINRLCFIGIVISLLVGYINPYEHYISFFVNLWYPLALFIYLINIKAATKAAESKIFKNELNALGQNHLKTFYSKKIKIFMIAMLCFLKIVWAIVEYIFYIDKTDLSINLFKNDFLMKNAFWMFILATISEIVVLIIYSIRIWKENKEEEVTVICS